MSRAAGGRHLQGAIGDEQENHTNWCEDSANTLKLAMRRLSNTSDLTESWQTAQRGMTCDRDGTRHNERPIGNVLGMKICHFLHRSASAEAMARFSRDRTGRNSSAHVVSFRNLCPSTPKQGKCWTDVRENLFALTFDKRLAKNLHLRCGSTSPNLKIIENQNSSNSLKFSQNVHQTHQSHVIDKKKGKSKFINQKFTKFIIFHHDVSD